MSSLAPKQTRRRRPRKQKTIGVSAIQARLIAARTEVKSKIKTDDWETCKERVNAAKAELGKLMKNTEDLNASKPSTSGQSDSTVRTSGQTQAVTSYIADTSFSLRAGKKLCDNETSNEVAKNVEKMHDIDLNPDATRLISQKSEEWERCKERVRVEKAKLNMKLKN